MTALILAEDFTRKAIDAGRELLAGEGTVVAMKEPPDHFVSKAGTQLPKGAVEIATIDVEGSAIVIFMIS